VALGVKIGSWSVATSDTVGTTFAQSGFGFVPTALIVWTTARMTDGSSTSLHGRKNFGYCTGTSNRVTTMVNSRDANATTDCDSMIRTDCMCGYVGPTGTFDGAMDLSSFDADGFTPVIDVQHAVAMRYNYIALGGSDLTNVACGTWTEPGSTGVQAIITGLAFQPTFAFLSGTQATATNTRTDDWSQFHGVMDGTSEWVCAYAENHGLTDGDPWSYGRNGECAALFDGTAAINANATNFRASFSSFNSDGLSINVAERTGSRLGSYLALRGPRFKVTSVTTRTDGNNIAITTAGVGTPKLAFLMSNGVAEHSADTPTNGGSYTVGVAESTTSRFAHTMRSEDAAATTNIASHQVSDGVYVKTTTAGVLDAEMDLVSFDSDGATFVMDNTEPASGESWVGVVLFGDASPAITRAPDAGALAWTGYAPSLGFSILMPDEA
jgi:hypothetical protein